MQWLLTGLSTGAAVVAIVSAIYSRHCAVRADRDADRLARARSRVLTVESQLETLTRHHQKLQGRFYAALGMIERDREQRLEEIDVEHVQHNDEMTARQVMAFGCENWRIAAMEGPRSEAASCECEYCVSMREARRQMKAQLVPKGQAARVEATRKGQQS